MKESHTAIPVGTLFEYRVARLRFIQGSFVRRSIDIWSNTQEGQQLAEIDCLAISFDPQIRRTVELIECKTNTGKQKEIDRLVWLKGMGAYIKTDTVSFAKLKVASHTRDFARQIGVNIQDESAIATSEYSLRISKDWWPGFHNPEFGEQVVKPARKVLTSSHELHRAGKYLFGSFWFTDDFTRIKQLRSLYRLLIENSNKISPDALRLGLGEATTLFVLTTLSVASWQNQMAPNDFRSLLSQELSTGLGDPQSLRMLLRRIDNIQRHQIESLHEAYQETGKGRIPFVVRSLETDILTPPEWIEGYIELISRFSRRPNLANNILRWIDLWSAELLGYKISRNDLSLFENHRTSLESATEVVIAFLSRMWDVPDKILDKNADLSKHQEGSQKVDRFDTKISVDIPESSEPISAESSETDAN
ncbi:MAG: hypothetical protein EI684_12350 [Candidatus Viridilinea halotolerans]|uniref:Uncharacterized protein n=1 Tax=Candidatus Viridilinea halotolerans TaxID=2491704 RepID=A0A426TY95_9CHLR|nr:MAG: hypothetical protein EI684_12350 [Candidatus Viridilinea halotolerans]